MSMEIMTIQNVRVYLDSNNVAWINAEDVARGLGFVDYQEKVSATGGRKTYEVIRWARVNGYLKEWGFPLVVGKDDYIPENMFYRLAMKASNEAAKKFQAKVADEILPTIRKHGVYATNDFLSRSIADPVWAIGVLTALKKEQDKAALLETQLAEAKPKIDYCDWILQCANCQGEMWLLYQKYAAQGWSQTKTHKYVDGDGKIHCKVHTYWTQKGRLGLYELLKRKGYLPMIERAA